MDKAQFQKDSEERSYPLLDITLLEMQVSSQYQLLEGVFLDEVEIKKVMGLDLDFNHVIDVERKVEFIQKLFELELIDAKSYLYLLDNLIHFLQQLEDFQDQKLAQNAHQKFRPLMEKILIKKCSKSGQKYEKVQQIKELELAVQYLKQAKYDLEKSTFLLPIWERFYKSFNEVYLTNFQYSDENIILIKSHILALFRCILKCLTTQAPKSDNQSQKSQKGPLLKLMQGIGQKFDQFRNVEKFNFTDEQLISFNILLQLLEIFLAKMIQSKEEFSPQFQNFTKEVILKIIFDNYSMAFQPQRNTKLLHLLELVLIWSGDQHIEKLNFELVMIFSKVINQKLEYIIGKKEVQQSWMVKFEFEMRYYIHFLNKFFGSLNLDLYYVKFCDLQLFTRNLMQDAIHKMLKFISQEKKSKLFQVLQQDFKRLVQKIIQKCVQNQNYLMENKQQKIEISQKFSHNEQILQFWKNQIQVFNEKPKNVVKYFQKSFNNEEEPTEEEKIKINKNSDLQEKFARQIALFLKNDQELNPQLLMEILGKNAEFQKLILKKYINAFNFKNMSVVKSMRIFFGNLLMFGESAMIEQVLDAFSSRYFNQNEEKSGFDKYDDVYIFVYQIIMLNTGIYNKQVEDPMTEESFKKMCFLILKDNEENHIRLSTIYKNIQNQELKIVDNRDLIFEEKFLPVYWTYFSKNSQNQQKLLRDAFPDMCSVGKEISLLKIQQILSEEIEHTIGSFFTSTNLHYDEKYQFLNNYFEMLLESKSYEIMDKAVITLCKQLQIIQNKKLGSPLTSPSLKELEQPTIEMEASKLFFGVIKKCLPFLDKSLEISIDRFIANIAQGLIPFPDQLIENGHDIIKKLKGKSQFKKKVQSQSTFMDMFSTFLMEHEESSEEDIFELEMMQGSEEMKSEKGPESLKEIVKENQLQEKKSEDIFNFNPFQGSLQSLMQEMITETTFVPDDNLKKIFQQMINSITKIQVKQENLKFLPYLVNLMHQIIFNTNNKGRIAKIFNNYINFLLSISFSDCDKLESQYPDFKDQQQVSTFFKQKSTNWALLEESTNKTHHLIIQQFGQYLLLKTIFQNIPNSGILDNFEILVQKSITFISDCQPLILSDLIQSFNHILNSMKAQDLIIENDNFRYSLTIIKRISLYLDEQDFSNKDIQDLGDKFIELILTLLLKFTEIQPQDSVKMKHFEISFKFIEHFWSSKTVQNLKLYEKILVCIRNIIQTTVKNLKSSNISQNLLLFYQKFITNLIISSQEQEIELIFNLWQQILVECQTIEFTEHQTCELLSQILKISEKILTCKEEKIALIYVEKTSRFYLNEMQKLLHFGIFDEEFEKLLEIYHQIILSQKYAYNLKDTIKEHLKNIKIIYQSVIQIPVQMEENPNPQDNDNQISEEKEEQKESKLQQKSQEELKVWQSVFDKILKSS